MPTQRTLSTWLKATRPQFFTVIVLPIGLGTAMAWSHHGIFLAQYFILALCAGILAHAGVNVLNDYFDHLNQADEYNTEPLTPFAGGSRMIQHRLLSPRETFYYGLLLLAGMIAIGLFLVWTRGVPLLYIGLAGALSGVFYSSPPLAFHSRGLGELLVGLNFGVLAVLGAYYVQTQAFDGAVLAASLPLAFLVTAILYINEFPDYDSDRRAGKRTLVVRLGRDKARAFFLLLVVASFLSLLLGVGFALLPLSALLALLALPLAYRAVHVLYAAHDRKHALIPGIQSTIMLHTATSVLLIAAFVMA
jgi:1,4-dihydroxy-2-naphthoate octaprenyltransferase